MTEVKRQVGKTKNTLFEFGLRKTFPLPLPAVWQYLMSPGGIRIWLGESPDFSLVKGATYHTVDGAMGKVTTITPDVNIRVTWQPVGWSKPSTIQVRVIPAGDKTTVSFHQENLPDAQTRESMLERWKRVTADLEHQMLNSFKK